MKYFKLINFSIPVTYTLM